MNIRIGVPRETRADEKRVAATPESVKKLKDLGFEVAIERGAGAGCGISDERIPRVTRAQKMDVLSSQANLAGYRAVIEAAQQYQGFFGPQMTAAGATPPAKVLVIGAGVAGLAAIAT